MRGMSSSTEKASGACDTCRRQKVRCSGTQPCERCERTGVACTFGRAVGRTTTAEYTRHLENKITELQTLLQQRCQTAEARQQHAGLDEGEGNIRDSLIDTFIRPEDDYIFMPSQRQSVGYHGRYGGLSSLRIVRNLCDTVRDPTLAPIDVSGADMAEAFDTSLYDLPLSNNLAAFAMLPSQNKLEKTISTALDVALSCRECLDRDELWRDIHDLYDRDPEDHRDEDRSLLALVYALMALGRRYEPHESNDVDLSAPGRVALKGLSYFRASRAIVDSTGYADLNIVRATICLSTFLLSSSMVSKAYSIICVGASAALRLGLHVSSTNFRQSLSAYELTQRRRTFAVLNFMDILTSSTLGMPNVLRGADSSQILPIPEEHLEDEGTAFVLANPFSPVADTIFSAKIYRILGKIVESRLPNIYAQPNDVYEVDHAQITRFAAELEVVHKQLPQVLPDATDQKALLAQLYLRFQHAGVQLILYRPFLAHVVRQRQDPSFNYDGYAFGSAGLRAATQVVWILDAFNNYGFLHEAQSWAIFLLSQAATSLIYFVLGNQNGATVEESKAAAMRATELLRDLAAQNLAARTCYESLAPLVVHLQSSQSPPDPPSPRTTFMRGIGVEDFT